MLGLIRTISEILTAGIAITAFSLLLYALAFNLMDRVARSFALILVCVVGVFTAEAIGGTAGQAWEQDLWLRIQWVGIAFLPAVYLHFSDALMATTGKPSRGRRRWAIRLAYLVSGGFLVGLWITWLIVPQSEGFSPVAHLRPTFLTDMFVVYYFTAMIVAWVNFVRAYRRSATTTSRRRIVYLITGALAPALGSFPVLPYNIEFAGQHQYIFWSLSLAANLFVGVLLVVMAYAVAFFGVAWPDRVVKARLFKWLMRGPVTASITLGAVTIVRRVGEAFGYSYTAGVPIVMVVTILILEYLITLFAPLGERVLFYGNDRKELESLKKLEDQLVTNNDLTQFFEMVLAAIIDRLQASGAYIIALSSSGSEIVVTVGKTRFDNVSTEVAIPEEVMLSTATGIEGIQYFNWGNDTVISLFNGTPEHPELLGLLGVTGAVNANLDAEQIQSFELLAHRASLALRDRRVQQQIFKSLEDLSLQVDLFQRLRAAGRYDREGMLTEEDSLPNDDIIFWVKEALTHYWGGPKLTNSPLIKFKIVQVALKEHDGNQANALRAILRQAIEQTRPEGERRFTAEWILYNILDMKFVEGRKVREIALRLAMSEADLYRKQRVAIEAVSKAIAEMETQARMDLSE
jgi:hypothetical protein